MIRRKCEYILKRLRRRKLINVTLDFSANRIPELIGPLNDPTMGIPTLATFNTISAGTRPEQICKRKARSCPNGRFR